MISFLGKLVHSRCDVPLHDQVDLEEAEMDETEEIRVKLPAKRLKLNTVGVGKVMHWALCAVACSCSVLQSRPKSLSSCALFVALLRRTTFRAFAHETIKMSLQASGRGWKVPGERAGSLRNPLLSSSWDKKMADKAAAQQFRAVKKAALDAYKEKKQV